MFCMKFVLKQFLLLSYEICTEVINTFTVVLHLQSHFFIFQYLLYEISPEIIATSTV